VGGKKEGGGIRVTKYTGIREGGKEGSLLQLKELGKTYKSTREHRHDDINRLTTGGGGGGGRGSVRE